MDINEKQFQAIQFNPKYHTYTLDGQRLTSVTAKIGTLKPPFDAPRIAQRVADREGKTVDDVLAEWDAKREAGLARGTAVHEYIEGVLTGRQPAGDPFLALNERLPEQGAFDRLWSDLKDVAKVARCEWVVGDATLGVAGTVDALLWNPEREVYSLWDWKTGGRFERSNNWENLLPPFDDLDNSEFYVYSLQLSLYKLVIQRSLDIPVGGCYIVHLSPDGEYEVHLAEDLTGRLEAWL